MQRQQQEAVGALKGMSASAVIQGLRMGQLGALEDAARNHTAFVESAGLQKGAHFAFNGKLSTFQGQPQVRVGLAAVPLPLLLVFENPYSDQAGHGAVFVGAVVGEEGRQCSISLCTAAPAPCISQAVVRSCSRFWIVCLFGIGVLVC